MKNLTERDYAKEANQIHIAFHDNFLNVKEKDEKVCENAHCMFDTLVLWIEEMQKKIYRLEGAIEEARKRP